MSKANKVAVTLLTVLIAATLLFIWGHSLMPGSSSQAESDTLRRLLAAVFGEGAVAAFLLKHIRKVAHFAEFFALGAEVAALRRLRKTPVMGLYGLGVAAIDELLQFIAPHRSPQVTDVLLDYSGYLCGFGLLTAALWVFTKFHLLHKN